MSIQPIVIRMVFLSGTQVGKKNVVRKRLDFNMAERARSAEDARKMRVFTTTNARHLAARRQFCRLESSAVVLGSKITILLYDTFLRFARIK